MFHFTVETPRLMTYTSFIRLGVGIKCILKTSEITRDLLFINDKTKYFYENCYGGRDGLLKILSLYIYYYYNYRRCVFVCYNIERNILSHIFAKHSTLEGKMYSV